ncbi:hypothetical protein J4526_05665 [Desulfurococcaceae archaeon MEX13E-LK6-19]|nr:hypothetical protein J4526_05665 [Desulfurococcaceae archaeon MEX13E-LK6-19]
MDIRFVLAGINIIAVAIVMAVYGWLTYSTQLIGIAGSIGIVGAVSVAVGLSHGEPTAVFLKDYYRIISGFVLKTLEDLRLINILPKILFIKESNEYYMVLTQLKSFSGIGKEITPGIMIVNGAPSYVFKLPNIYAEAVEEPITDPIELESRVKSLLIETYGLCTRVSITRTKDLLDLSLEGVDKKLLEVLYEPLSPIDVVVLTILAQLMKKSLYMESRSIEGDTYTAKIRVVL